MNILLWILQILLAIWEIIGGIFMLNNYAAIANIWALSTLPKPVWIGIGALQILCAVGLVLPMRKGALQNANAISAIGVTAISLLGIILYSSYSGFPGMLWGVIPAALAAFVAYGRMKK